MKPKCLICKKNYKVLTKEELCAFCYKLKYGVWSKEFQAEEGKK